MEVSTLGFNCEDSIGQRELVDEESSHFQVQPPIFVDSTTIGRMVNLFMLKRLGFFVTI